MLLLPAPRVQVPVVFMERRAFTKASAEARKFFYLGKQKEGTPWEASMYYLSHLALRDGIEKSPLELVELEEVDSIIITHVVIPPDIFKDNKPGYSGFTCPTGWTSKRMNEVFERQLNSIVSRYPLLDVTGNIHSHPWRGNTWLSGSDHEDTKRSMASFRESGLNTRFKFLLTPLDKDGNNWMINGYGYDHSLQAVSLPDVVLVSRKHQVISSAKVQPFYKLGSAWIEALQDFFNADGYAVKGVPIVRGWYRIDIVRGNGNFAICIPPFFPETPIRVYRKSVDNQLELITESFWSD